jgi:hypothetical protein
MVGYRMFNIIHQRLMEVMQIGKPFGGVSIIAVGDLYQLPPVFDTYVFRQPKSGFMPLATNMWTDLFQLFELKCIMRQADNKEFAELLNRLREGNHTSDDIKILKTRIIQKDSEHYPYDAIHLMHTNDSVNAYNNVAILRSQNPSYTINAKDRVVGSTPPNMRKKILEQFRKSHAKNCQLPNTVVACKDICYDLTVNLDTADGLTNGATCKIMKIDIELTDTLPSGIIWVQFLEPSSGKSLRSESKRLYRSGYNPNWTPLHPVAKEFAAGKDGRAQIQRYQFPLRPAHAKSIHRSQGDTLDTAVVDLTLTRKIDHIHYVALSRLQSLDKLYITNLQEDKISVDKEVQKEMDRMRNSPLVFSHHFLTEQKFTFKLAFLNARSLHKHLQDVQIDRNVQSADVIGFCETRFNRRDATNDTAIPDFSQFRQDYQLQTLTQRSFYGLSVYSKSSFTFGPFKVSNQVEATVFKVLQQPDIVIIIIYKSPKVSTKPLLNLLDSVHDKYIKNSKAVILGDFNIDWSQDTSDKRALNNLMKKLHFNQVIHGPTNDHNSTIDLIFTNIETYSCGTLETYYTDHKMCWIGWNNIHS